MALPKLNQGVKNFVNEGRELKKYIFSLLYIGISFQCPVCKGHFRKFLPWGRNHRKNARCPRCYSLERHRLIFKYLSDRTDFFRSNLKVLHFAPEACLQRRFKSLPNLEYISADLEDPLARVRMDISNIGFHDNTFDCVLCTHVLEHVIDDHKAMRELYRVLKPGGWAMLQVPIKGEKTFEDAAIKSPSERLKYFGQEDHVRIYGLDYKNRLQNAGFIVKVDPYAYEQSEEVINKYRLVPKNESKEYIYVCYKA
jgi:predicted SAM-dependent methyltransferase